MAEVVVRDGSGQPVSSVEVPEFLADGEVNAELLHQVVVAHLANRRQGTASTKSRGEVRGSGRKLFRQKGLGRARMGSSRSPLRVGGGVAFGPRPRSFRQETPRKMRRRALVHALRDKIAQGSVVAVQEIPGDRSRPKTREIAQLLAGLDLAGRKVVIVLAEPDAWVHRSARNLPRVSVTTCGLLHAHEVVVHDVLVFGPEAFAGLADRLRPDGGRVGGAEAADDEVEVS